MSCMNNCVYALIYGMCAHMWCVHTYAYMHERVNVSTWACVLVWKCECEDIQVYACVHMCMYIHAGKCSCISVFCDCVHLSSSAYACVDVCILVHVHTCMFTDNRIVMQHSPEKRE